MWLDAFAGLVLFLVSVTLLDSEVDPSTVGLVLTYTLSLREVLHLLVQASCGVESSAGAIQKMDQHAHMEREVGYRVERGKEVGYRVERKKEVGYSYCHRYSTVMVLNRVERGHR